MKKILVPCDFSLSAQQAYKFAIDIASVSGGEIFVLKVVEIPYFSERPYYMEPYAYEPSGLFMELQEDAAKHYEIMKDKYPGGTSKVSFSVEQGHLIHAITKFISDKDIDLVVMGTHGVSGWQEFFVGSNTEKIVRMSPVPVFAIREAPDIASIRNIVLPTDLDPGQADWMIKVKALQDFFHATLHLILINTPAKFMRGIDAKDKLEKYAKRYGLTRYTLNVRNDFLEQDGVISFAYEIDADMIAMATHGRRGLAHLTAGSVAEKVVNRMVMPIWTSTVGKRASAGKKSRWKEQAESHV